MTTARTNPRTAGSATARATRRPTGGHQPKHAPRVPFALLVGGLVIGGMCALLALNTASAANELARHRIAGQDSDVAGQLEQVRNQVAASAAPGSLGQAAAELGMVAAGAPAFLKINADGKVVLLGSPAPATSVPPPPPPVVKKTTPAAKPKPKTKAKTTAKTKTKTSVKAQPTKPKPTPTPITTLPGGTR